MHNNKLSLVDWKNVLHVNKSKNFDRDCFVLNLVDLHLAWT